LEQKHQLQHPWIFRSSINDHYSEEADKCEKYFAGGKLDFGGKVNLTQEEIDEHLTYECVKRSQCNDDRNAIGISPKLAGVSLTSLINSAQSATCQEYGNDFVCCNKNYIQKESCKVKEIATSRFIQCEFPFKFEGETHNE